MDPTTQPKIIRVLEELISAHQSERTTVASIPTQPGERIETLIERDGD
jgi:hypothetical protein